MPENATSDAARVESLLRFLSTRPDAYRMGPADSALVVPCQPYVLLFKNTANNIDIEIHLHTNLKRWQGLEPLLNTRRGTPLVPKIRRFRDNWMSVRDEPENAFRLVTTLAQVFAILLPEDQTS